MPPTRVRPGPIPRVACLRGQQGVGCHGAPPGRSRPHSSEKIIGKEFALEFTPDLIAVFVTLFVLEVVLGVDNVIFISILASKLPTEQQAKARNLGLTLAMFLRVLLVLFAGWIITLDSDLFSVFGLGFSGRDLILIAGGLFLLYKAVHEIHQKLEGADDHGTAAAAKATFGAVIAQILALDLVFSLDSVITAVGMTDNVIVIITVVGCRSR